MNSTILATLGIGSFILGYRFYSSYITRNIYFLHTYKKRTPAHDFRDEIDFVPTKKHILFGHHFTSIAGAAPIIDPCVASYWGWLPAFAWVVLGTIFMGTIHNFGASNQMLATLTLVMITEGLLAVRRLKQALVKEIE